jgi:hypothetical protein
MIPPTFCCTVTPNFDKNQLSNFDSVPVCSMQWMEAPYFNSNYCPVWILTGTNLKTAERCCNGMQWMEAPYFNSTGN